MNALTRRQIRLEGMRELSQRIGAVLYQTDQDQADTLSQVIESYRRRIAQRDLSYPALKIELLKLEDELHTLRARRG